MPPTMSHASVAPPFSLFPQDEHGVATVIQRALRAKRARMQDKGSNIHCGYLLKTPTKFGPLHKHREAVAMAVAGAPAPALADLPPYEPHFAKYFVLDETKRTLAIFTNEEARRSGEAPKFTLSNMREYALLRLKKNSSGSTTLALLPSAAIKEDGGSFKETKNSKSWSARHITHAHMRNTLLPRCQPHQHALWTCQRTDHPLLPRPGARDA